MAYNHSINLSNDPVLPDLLPEEPLFHELLQINDLTMPVFHPDIAELTRRLDNLTVEYNTQGLRLAVEKAKRQRLQTMVHQIKSDLTRPNPELIALRSEINQMKDYQNAVNHQLDNENARTNTLSFRSFSRIGQLFAELTPCVTLPPNSSPEVQTLLRELLNTVQHFGVYYAASHE